MSRDDAQAGTQHAVVDRGVATRPVIAVFNSSSDTVDLLRRVLEQGGLQTVVGHIPEIKHGGLDLIAFIERHAPAVIVYDVSPPYEENWTFLRLLHRGVSGKPFVFTTTKNRPPGGLGAPRHRIIGSPTTCRGWSGGGGGAAPTLITRFRSEDSWTACSIAEPS